MNIEVKAVIKDCDGKETVIDICDEKLIDLALENKNDELIASGRFGKIESVIEFQVTFTINGQDFEFSLNPKESFSMKTIMEDGIKEELCSFSIKN